MEDEISRMAGLVQDLLLLSSIDAGSWTLHPSQINVDTLLITLYEKFEMICKKKSVILQLRMPEDCLPPLVSDENRLNQVLSIFLDNAISYSPEHSSVIWPSTLLTMALESARKTDRLSSTDFTDVINPGQKRDIMDWGSAWRRNWFHC